MLRLATDEERKDIEQLVDLSPEDLVVTDQYGNLALIRRVWEIDPAIFRSGKKGRAEFVASLEALLMSRGIERYYFEIAADDERYIKIAEKWGAVKETAAPGYRFKRELTSAKQSS